MQVEREEYAWVIDFLPHGRSSEREPEPMAQLIGEKFFTLFEVSVKKDSSLQFGQRVYLGKDERPQVERIRKRITFDDLTPTARNEAPSVLKNIIASREPDFINFFNKAGPLSVRLHQLELIHGIGKKHLTQILDVRESSPFTSFEDVKSRVPLLSDPMQMLAMRIMQELEGKEQNYLFVRPPRKEGDLPYRGHGGFRR